MLYAWYAVVLLIATTLPSPRSYRFRYQINAPHALVTDSLRVVNALERGLFADSLIVPGNTPLIFNPDVPPDSAARANATHTIVIRGSIREHDGRLEVQLLLLNILAQPVAGPDTLRFERAATDSVLVVQGRHYAERLAKGRR